MASSYTIDTGDSFNDNCVICCPMDDGVSAGEIENIVDDSTISLITGITNGSDHIIFDGTTGLATALTVACRSAFTALFEIELASVASDHGLWGIQHTTSPNCQLYIDNFASGDRLDAYFAGHTIATDASVNAINTRYTLAVTSDGDDINLYVDGTLDVASGGTNGVTAGTFNEFIGSAPNLTGKPLNGRMYHYRRYTRELTSTEVSDWDADTTKGLNSGGSALPLLNAYFYG